jgi:RHS repeat-associated protein
VNGTDNGGDDTDTSPIASNGPLEIGGDKWNGQPDIHNFSGTIKDVQVYPFALSAGEVSNLYHNGGDIVRGSLTTSYQVDQLGQVTAETSPDGITTSYAYDAAGQQALVTGPPVAAQVGGGTPVGARPVTVTGYNTFGEVTEAQDPNGNVTTDVYDADGRVVSQALPAYTPPGGTGPVSGTSVTAYNTLGQVTTQTDPLGNVTKYAYDQLGHRTSQTDPNNGLTSTSYDPVGEALSVTGPTGAQATSTYDYLGRQVTTTSVERYPSPASYTTITSYAPTPTDPKGAWKSLVTSPGGVATSYGYDAAGEATQVTDGAGNLTRYSFDALGRQTAVTNPDGTSATVTYDAAGNQLGTASLDAAGQTLAATSATYNGEGQQLSTIDALGYCTAYTYDPTGSLTAETQPVSSSAGVITSFGYDAAGNQTRYTDGNGKPWITTYNSWNLPETQVQPATSAYTTAANSTTTIAYNGDKQPVTVTEPGGVTVTDTYDAMGNVTGQSGSGASAPTASRSFSYDSAGNMLTAATSSTAASGHPSNATSETFTYNDRGLPLTASGSAGSTSYTYNGDGQQASAVTAAGPASYSYDSAGRLRTMADPASGATLTYSYNPMSQVSQVSYGVAGADVRALGYDSLHRLTSDTLTHGSTTLASISYGYNAGGYLTSKTTTGLAGASASTYGYDRAGRLTSWTSGTTTVSYAYDGAGNRTQAGSTTYTYDARDQLTGDGTSSYAYAADGDLTSVTGPSGTTASTSDAYGQQGAQGTQASTYDALGRDTALTAGSAVTALAYEGTSGLLAGDGASSYTYTPGGTLTGTAPATAPGTGVLDLTDHHTDLVAQFTPAGTTLSGSRTYGPWGAALPGGALAGSLGYQSQYTSPLTGQVNMGARWYNPATGSFANKDTVTNKPVPDSASASPFGYAADNPLGLTDPTGHQTDLPQLLNDKAAAIAAAAKTSPVKVAVAVTSVKTAKAAAAKTTVKNQPVEQSAAISAGCLALTLKSCAGALQSHAILDASPTQRAADYSAYQQVTAEAKHATATASGGKAAGAPAKLIQISPHVAYAAALPAGPALAKAYRVLSNMMANADEFTKWYYLCTENAALCAKVGLAETFSRGGIAPNADTSTLWAEGFEEVATQDGVQAWWTDPAWAFLSDSTAHVLNKWDDSQLSDAQLDDIIKTPSKFNAYMGDVIDIKVKDYIKVQAAEGNLIARGFELSDKWQPAIDADNLTNFPGTVNGYDFTTPRGIAQHVLDYTPTSGEGEVRLISWPTILRALIAGRGGARLSDSDAGGGGGE